MFNYEIDEIVYYTRCRGNQKLSHPCKVSGRFLHHVQEGLVLQGESNIIPVYNLIDTQGKGIPHVYENEISTVPRHKVPRNERFSIR